MTAYRMVPSTIARPVREVVQILDYYPKTLCPASVATSGVLACYRYQHPIPTPPHISLGLTCCPKLPHKLTQLTYQNVAGFFYYFIQISFLIISSHYDMKFADEMSTRIEVEMEINFEKKLIAVVKCFVYNIIP